MAIAMLLLLAGVGLQVLSTATTSAKPAPINLSVAGGKSAPGATVAAEESVAPADLKVLYRGCLAAAALMVAALACSTLSDSRRAQSLETATASA